MFACLAALGLCGLWAWLATSPTSPTRVGESSRANDAGVATLEEPVDRPRESAASRQVVHDMSRVTPPMSRASSGLASSPAAPTLTLQGAIRQVVQDFGVGSSAPSYLDAAVAAGSPQFNPTGRVLTAEKVNELEALIRKLESARRDVTREVSAANRDALLRSLDAGRVESIEYVTPRDSNSDADLAFAAQENQRRREMLSASLSRRLGVRDKDWFCAVVQTNEPDHVVRLNVVYYTREQEPNAVAIRVKLPKAESEADDAIKSWFSNQ